jgi:hypothetical protein
MNPLDMSMDAALELEELKQGGRDDAPALHHLIELLRTPSRGFSGEEGISMLADMRSFTMFRESLGQVWPKLRATNYDKLPQVISDFLSELERGVHERNDLMVARAEQFCLALNTSLLAKQMSDIYTRRERADARYISHESLP